MRGGFSDLLHPAAVLVMHGAGDVDQAALNAVEVFVQARLKNFANTDVAKIRAETPRKALGFVGKILLAAPGNAVE